MIDIDTYLRFILALAAVLGLIGGAAWIFKRYGVERHLVKRSGDARKRLGVVEMQTVDPRHKLLLLRRDDVEHLVLLGPNQDLLLEQNIPQTERTALEDDGAKAKKGGLFRLHQGSARNPS